MDLLADVLALAGVQGTLGARLEAAEPWGLTWHTVDEAAFYAVTAGSAWLRVLGRDPVQLRTGDVALLPTGAPHAISSAPGTWSPDCRPEAAAHARRTGEVLRFGHGEPTTFMLAAAYSYDHSMHTQVLPQLPEVVHLRGEHGANCLDDTVRLLARELAHPQLASGVVLDKLVDILLIQFLRVWIGQRPDELRQSWLGVLDDPLLTEALTKLHADPARAWTTDLLAAELAVSRSTVTRRFLAVLGQTPGNYLTQWRMDLAARRLRDGDAPLELVARSVGYTSVYAFSRAFSRTRGVAPGRYRTTARSAAKPSTADQLLTPS